MIFQVQRENWSII